MLDPVILSAQVSVQSHYWRTFALDDAITHPGSLTSTGDTSTTSALPSPAVPEPYPVSSCSSRRAVVLGTLSCLLCVHSVGDGNKLTQHPPLGR